jgi:hypothetical protein
MRNSLTAFCVAATLFVLPQSASADPVRFVVNRTAHYVHKAGQKIDRHVIRPGKRVIANHTWRVRTVHRSS